MVDTQFREHAIRMGILAKRLYDPEMPGGDTITVLFAETTEARMHLALQLFLDSLRWQFLLVASGLLLLMLGLSRTFRPLLALRESIRQRADGDLTPVPMKNVPAEVLPLIDAINNHISRQADMMHARRRFLADAAHQIRTPLAVLGTQAEYGGRQCDPDEMRSTFASMLRSIRGTRHMANQMLALARAEQATDLIKDRTALDFADLVRDVAGDFAALALTKNIDLAFEAPDSPAYIRGNAIMLREMVSNLADNALRYTPEGGHVTLSVSSDQAKLTLRVSDDGPGIPAAERNKVFQRFYRILGSGDTEGSGLGLCIVREICLAHGGAIELTTGPAARGLVAEITFPHSAKSIGGLR
jgi:two-component system sensor histidine kinase TctE